MHGVVHFTKSWDRKQVNQQELKHSNKLYRLVVVIFIVQHSIKIMNSTHGVVVEEITIVVNWDMVI